MEHAVAAAVVAPAAAPPPPLTVTTATLTHGLVPLKCGLVLGGRRPAASPDGHAGQRSHLRSSSAVGRPDLHAALGPSTFGSVDTMDELLGPAATGPLLPHNGDGSSRGHRLGRRF
jgi:hypothetical protein